MNERTLGDGMSENVTTHSPAENVFSTGASIENVPFVALLVARSFAIATAGIVAAPDAPGNSQAIETERTSSSTVATFTFTGREPAPDQASDSADVRAIPSDPASDGLDTANAVEGTVMLFPANGGTSFPVALTESTVPESKRSCCEETLTYDPGSTVSAYDVRPPVMFTVPAPAYRTAPASAFEPPSGQS